MEIESDAKTLESRLAQIKEWKKCKDDAEYRAKVKAENEYWEAINNLKQYHKRIEDICTLAEEICSSGYKIYIPRLHKICNLFSLDLNNNGRNRYFFGVAVYDNHGINLHHYILYDGISFSTCRSNCHNKIEFLKSKPETEILREIYNGFPEFEEAFYEWLDKTLNN